MNMKADEKCFFRLCWMLRNQNVPIRFVVNTVGEIIHYKRCWYYLCKWAGLGFYNYGVSLDLGWFEPDKLPERYRALIEERGINDGA